MYFKPFLKLVSHQESIISEEHLKAWLIRVTINQCKKRRDDGVEPETGVI